MAVPWPVLAWLDSCVLAAFFFRDVFAILSSSGASRQNNID